MNKFILEHNFTIIQISIIENLDIIHQFYLFLYLFSSCMNKSEIWFSHARVDSRTCYFLINFKPINTLVACISSCRIIHKIPLFKTLIVFSLPTSLYMSGHTDEFRIVDRKKYIMIWHPRADQSLTYCLVNYFCTFSNYCPS